MNKANLKSYAPKARLEFIKAVLEKKQIQIGVSYVAKDAEIVLAGAPELGADERTQFLDCYSSWSKRLQARR